MYYYIPVWFTLFKVKIAEITWAECLQAKLNDFISFEYYEENVVTSSKSNLLLMSFCLHIINYNS
jgi:hypothetical protein